MTTNSGHLLIGLGYVGDSVLDSLETKLRTRRPDIYPLPALRTLTLLEGDPNRPYALERPYLVISPQMETLAKMYERLYPQNTSLSTTNNAAIFEFINKPQSARLRGLISMHQHIDALIQALQSLQGEIQKGPGPDGALESSLVHTDELQVYVALSLADSFMCGLIPDFLYVLQHVLQNGATPNTVIIINLLLALPGFEGEVILPEQVSPTERAEIQSYINVNAAACLRELNYYLDDRHYYAQSFGSSIQVCQKLNPLGQGQVYIIEPTNEIQKRLQNVESLVDMVATWLYYVSTGSMERKLAPLRNPQNQQTTYASFGISSLSIPLERWVECAAVDLEIDLMNTYLKRREEGLGDDTPHRALDLTSDEIRTQITKDVGYAELRMNPHTLQRIPVYQASKYLVAIQQQYTSLLSTKLPQLISSIRKLLYSTEKNTSIQEQLTLHIKKLLEEPAGGLVHAQEFMAALSEDFRKEQLVAEDRETAYQDKVKGAVKRVTQTRDKYSRSAEIANKHDFFPFSNLALIMCIGALPLFFWLYRLWNQQHHGLVLLLASLFLLSIVSLGILIMVNLRRVRAEVFEAYEHRLLLFKEIEFAQAIRPLYRNLESWLENLNRDVRKIARVFGKIRDDLLSRQMVENLKDRNQLCGLAPSRISESLLTTDVIAEYEANSRTAELKGELSELRVLGLAPADLISGEGEQSLDDSQIISKLNNFTRKKLSRHFSQLDLTRLFTRLPQKEQDRIVLRMLEISCPYWRSNQQSDLRILPLTQVVALANPGQHEDLKAVFMKQFHKLDLGNWHDFDAIDDKSELLVANVRSGFTLKSAGGAAKTLFEDYTRFGSNHTNSYHTMAERGVLPEPYDDVHSPHDIETMSAYHLCALAYWLRVIYEEEQRLCYAGSSSNENVRSLGKSLSEAIRIMQNDPQLLNSIRKSLQEKWLKPECREQLKQRVASPPLDTNQHLLWSVMAVRDFLETQPTERTR